MKLWLAWPGVAWEISGQKHKPAQARGVAWPGLTKPWLGQAWLLASSQAKHITTGKRAVAALANGGLEGLGSWSAKCGLGSTPISRAMRRQHEQDDREHSLKRNQPDPGPTLSAREFMARKRTKVDANQPTTSAIIAIDNSEPEGPLTTFSDALPLVDDVEMAFESADPPTSSNDIEMAAPAIESGASSPPADPLIGISAPDEVPEEPLTPRDSLAQESPFWFWQLILITVAWLHLHFHAPHRACTLLLKVLRHIFICLAHIRADDNVPVTLTTTFKRLGLNEDFEIRVICPQCRRVYPESSAADLMCSHCSIPLFNIPPAPTSQAIPLLGSNRPKSKPKPRPILQAPYLSLSSQIVEFLNREDNESDCESYLKRTPIPGKMRDIQDGEICQSLKGPDGRKFFETGPDRPDPDELRIGVCLGEDGFSFTRSRNAGTHTTGAASFCVTNLPNHKRYRPRNLLLTSLAPGPHEETADELQRSFAATVTDLLMLYDDGILVQTPKYPNDHKSAKFPCPRCSITHDDIQTPSGLKVDVQQLSLVAMEANTNGNELNMRKYLKMIRQPEILLQPRIFKTQWLNAWIQDPAALRKRTEKTTREIDHIHNYLNALEMPSWVARLPTQVGYPAGGSLTADELKGMLLIFCPLIIPNIWDEWYPIAAADHEKSNLSWKKKETARLNRIANETDTSADHNGPGRPPKAIRMHKNDPDLLLKFASSIKILLAGTIDVRALPRAQQLLEEYLTGFLEIIRDFGPVYGFWTFLFERLNKLLKSYDTNNHGDGELEVTFFREFHRDANLREVVRKLAKDGIEGLSPEEKCIAESARMILETDGETRGTVAAMACEIEELSSELGTSFSMGISVSKELPTPLQHDILEYYNTTYPTLHIVDRAADVDHTTNPIFLHGTARVHTHFILDGRRITSSTSLDDASSSLVQLDADGTRYVGQVFNILTHHQQGLERPQCLLDVRWMRRLTDCDMSAWEPYPELEIFSWEYGKFLRRTDPGPGRIVPIHSILSQACRLTIEHKTRIIEEDVDSDVEEAETSNGPNWSNHG
ncbi:hypothetical protein DFH07DRAFT_774194 [Mycena maculata]|uniref:Uncharacterized protein n=1 Tax=Mycena maculata TaxID=230809 RepID=A0AAD7IZM7_9AGAR|nr:hypothetical protein DFH07DRAFT_774194 [Mycena maculata]